MTCIVGVVHQGGVWLGGDSAGVAEYSMTVRKDRKVFTVGEFIFGFTTSFRMGQLIQYSFTPPAITHDDLMRYMSTDFVNEIRRTLQQGGYSKIESNVESGGQFLIGVRGRLFCCESDFQIGESIDGSGAVGCGAEIARGSLFSTRGMEPYDRIHEALSAAQYYSAGVRAPFNIVSV